jgi:hypothetical protein
MSGVAPAECGEDLERTASPAPSDLDADESAAAAASGAPAGGAAPYVLDTATGAVSVAAPPVPDAAALAAADAAWAAEGDPFADADAADFCPLPRFTCDADEGYIDLTNERMDDVGDLSHCADDCTELTLRCNVVRNVNLHRFACLKNLTLLDLYENRLTPLAFPANAKAPNALAWTPGMPRRVYMADSDLPQVKAALERIRTGESAEPIGKPFLTLTELKELDLSFNELRFTDNLEGPRALENLYLIENKVMAIGDLSHFASSLKLLELGSNRIRVMQNLEPLINLEQLYLGRNKISRIQGISTLKQLRVLHLQANRLVEIGDGILELENIEELYLSHNGACFFFYYFTNLDKTSHNVSESRFNWHVFRSHAYSLLFLPQQSPKWTVSSTLRSSRSSISPATASQRYAGCSHAWQLFLAQSFILTCLLTFDLFPHMPPQSFVVRRSRTSRAWTSSRTCG